MDAAVEGEDVVTVNGEFQQRVAGQTWVLRPAVSRAVPSPMEDRQPQTRYILPAPMARKPGAHPLFRLSRLHSVMSKSAVGELLDMKRLPAAEMNGNLPCIMRHSTWRLPAPYETVQTVDGESWYKQYAQPTVQRTPHEDSAGKITYDDEKIVEQLPQIPKRKDRV